MEENKIIEISEKEYLELGEYKVRNMKLEEELTNLQKVINKLNADLKLSSKEALNSMASSIASLIELNAILGLDPISFEEIDDFRGFIISYLRNAIEENSLDILIGDKDDLVVAIVNVIKALQKKRIEEQKTLESTPKDAFIEI